MNHLKNRFCQLLCLLLLASLPKPVTVRAEEVGDRYGTLAKIHREPVIVQPPPPSTRMWEGFGSLHEW